MRSDGYLRKKYILEHFCTTRPSAFQFFKCGFHSKGSKERNIREVYLIYSIYSDHYKVEEVYSLGLVLVLDLL